MRQPTKRGLWRDLTSLRGDLSGTEVLIAWRDMVTGELEDGDGNPIDPDDHRAERLVVFEETLVMERERAERHDLTILRPHEGVPGRTDLVEVPTDESIELRDPRDGGTAK